MGSQSHNWETELCWTDVELVHAVTFWRSEDRVYMNIMKISFFGYDCMLFWNSEGSWSSLCSSTLLGIAQGITSMLSNPMWVFFLRQYVSASSGPEVFPWLTKQHFTLLVRMVEGFRITGSFTFLQKGDNFGAVSMRESHWQRNSGCAYIQLADIIRVCVKEAVRSAPIKKAGSLPYLARTI